MAWPTSSTVAAAGVITAAARNDLRQDLLDVNRFVRKTADEPVTSSTTQQNDNELLLSIGEAGTYIFEVTLFATSAANAAGDLQVGFSFPTGTLHYGVAALDPALASGDSGTMKGQGILSATSGAAGPIIGLSTSTLMITLRGILIATATGTLQLTWAQMTSNANASTIKAGSFMTMKQVA